MVQVKPITLAALLVAASVAIAQGQPRRGMGPQPGRCRAMMADVKALDAKLDEKLGAMNIAKGEEKVEAMAALLNELVNQRKAIHEKMSACPMMGQ